MITAAATSDLLDHPGYQRHCALPLCEAAFHVLRGPAPGWRMGRGGPIGGAYFCPAHTALALAHITRWVQGAVTGTLCACGWKWQPQDQATAGDHRLAWLLHLREDQP
jgi:hypothetical protein